MRAFFYSIVVVFLVMPFSLQANIRMPENTIPIYSDKVLKDRLFSMPSPIKVMWNASVKHQVNGYMIRGRKSTETILGKSSIYFPIFDEYLEKYGLPKELKYLSVIESRLRPTVVSHAGAGGLWQLMPRTAKRHGLKITNYVDERFDPIKSTEAAMKHLTKLYDQFENWTLAIAAYNCGSGRMNSSIKKANSKNFQKVRKYLPKETQMYVKRFMAASYAMHYYLFHDLHPRFPDYDVQLTAPNVVYDRRSFRQISKETGVTIDVLKTLNPSYLKEIIPTNQAGNYLILPIVGRIDTDGEFLTQKT